MYQPELEPNLIQAVYRLAKARKKPMTKTLAEVVDKGLTAYDGTTVCAMCRSRQNDTDCDECAFRERGLYRVANGSE